jgi:hypothetical protein
MSSITETGGVAATKTALVCPWCTTEFKPRRGGSAQRFCSGRCRTACWSALRRWGERAVAAGVLSIDAVRNGQPEACTLQGTPKAPPPCAEIGSTDQPPPDAATARFVVEIPQALIERLIFRHFAICHYQRDDLPALLAALARLRHRPKISKTSEHVTLSF